MEKSYKERGNFLNRRLYSNNVERKNVLNLIFFLFVLIVGHSLSAQTYCVPSNTNSSSYYISSVKTIGALQDINKTSGFSPSGYGDYTATDTLIVHLGQTITFEAKHPSSTYAYNVWIDWDKNGDFTGANENVLTTGTSYVASPVSTSMTIPLTAPLGATRIRIRNAYLSAPAPDCGSHDYGETEDYIIKVVQLNSCTGQPFAGTVIAGTPVCSNTAFNIQTNGVTFEDGLTGVWQSSPAGANTWTDMFGATSTNYTVVGGIIGATDYRYIITCANSSLSDTTGVISFTLKAGNECYCTPTNTTNTSYYISSVKTTGALQDVNRTSTFSPNGYGDYTATDTLIVYLGQTISFEATHPSSTYTYDVWIDWNVDGSFTGPNENVLTTNGTYVPSPIVASMTIPLTAPIGATRIRIRNAYLDGPALSCGSNAYGETEDYIIKIIQLDPCAGQPTAGVITSGEAICSGIAFTVKTTGSTLEDGITGIWQSSPTGANTWTDITGATTSSYTLGTGITASTDYRYIVTCANNSLADTSSVISYTIKPANQCYCTPTGNSTSYYVNDFSTTGGVLNVSNLGSGYSASGYGDFTATQTVSQARTQPVNFSGTYVGTTFGTKIWVDWNQDGLFDATEIVYQSTSYASNVASSFTVPNTAALGTTRMRIGISSTPNSGPANACVTGLNGEYEDYTFEVLPFTGCAGQPTAGTITTPMAVCAGVGFNLTATGASLPAANLNGVWQSSPAGANTWTSIPGATNSNYNFSAGVTAATDFRFILNCGNSSLADTSNVLSVTLKPANQCYCTPGGNSASYYVNNFSTTGGVLNVSNLSSGYSTGGYGDFTATDTVSQVRTQAINFTSVYGSGSNTYGTKIWIDWNQDGQFDATEIVYQTSNYANGESGSITVPNTAALGSTRMRIGISFTPSTGPASACETSLSGEYEDYIFKVLPLPECAGTPTAGTIGSSITICSGTDYTVSTTGISSPANNLSGIWQSSPAGANTWTNIPGATSASYTVVGGTMSSKDYRYVITCANNSSSDTSGVLSVTLKLANECYCIPTYTSNCTLNDVIDNVTLNGGSVNLNNNSNCGGGYTDFTTVAAPDLMAGSTYTVSVTNSTTRAPEDDVRIWIDWNQNGTFENSEVIASTNGARLVNNTLTGNFMVPAGQATGNYRMRVRLVYHGGAYISPCSNEIYGETEDYTVKVVTPCTNPVVYLGADKMICSGASVTLDVGNPGLTYLWNDGSTNQTLVVTTPGTYSVTVTNGACSASDNILVSNYPAPSADSIVAVNNGSCQFDFSLANAQNVTGYKWSFGDGSATVNTASPSHTFTTDGSYNISVTIANNCNDTTTITKTIICNILGVKDVTPDNNNFRLYPNPTSSDVTIEVSGVAIMESVTIIDNVGKVVFYGTPSDTTKYSIDVSKLSNGLYTALIRTNKGMATKKFEVSK